MMDINALFYVMYSYTLERMEKRDPRRSKGRHIVGKVLRARQAQIDKGRKPYWIHERGGHW